MPDESYKSLHADDRIGRRANAVPNDHPETLQTYRYDAIPCARRMQDFYSWSDIQPPAYVSGFRPTIVDGCLLDKHPGKTSRQNISWLALESLVVFDFARRPSSFEPRNTQARLGSSIRVEVASTAATYQQPRNGREGFEEV